MTLSEAQSYIKHGTLNAAMFQRRSGSMQVSQTISYLTPETFCFIWYMHQESNVQCLLSFLCVFITIYFIKALHVNARKMGLGYLKDRQQVIRPVLLWSQCKGTIISLPRSHICIIYHVKQISWSFLYKYFYP